MSLQSESLQVAVCQLTSVDDVQANLEFILKALESLGSAIPDLICFPENALYLRVKEGEKIPSMKLNDPALRTLSTWAKTNGTHLHLGSVPLEKEGQLYNSSLLLSPDGTVRDHYQKIHLFDVDVEGHKPVRESDAFAHGQEPSIFEIKGWKIGSSICYDMRFPELFLRYARAEVDVILIPSAFLVPTGRAHWEVLTRARAIEAQAYVLAAAQGGEHRGAEGGIRRTYGHSEIVDPWGVIVAECMDDQVVGPGVWPVLRAELSRERIRKIREQIPMKNHRRLV